MDYYSFSEEKCQGMSVTLDGSASAVPPGFRFHPTDEELVGYYLHKKLACKKIDMEVIKEIDLYKLEPWDLKEKCRIGSVEQNEWYFFSHKDKKYPTGTRTNRATTAGFWKATGRDKAIFTKNRSIGQRKTLVFYKGRAPNGQKTDWIMHEYRLEDEAGKLTATEDGWVVCRVFRKRSLQQQPNDTHASRDYGESLGLVPDLHSHDEHSFVCKHEFDLGSYEQHAYLFPRLPQLESSDICASDPPLHHLGLHRELSELQPLAFETSDQFESSTPTTSLFHQHAHHFPVLDVDEEVTEWSVVDRLLAAGQLNQQFSHKEKIVKSAAADTSLGELANLVRLSKGHQNTDYSSTCSGDIWSFADKNPTT